MDRVFRKDQRSSLPRELEVVQIGPQAISCLHGGDLVERHLFAVVVNADGVHHVDVGAASSGLAPTGRRR